MADKKDRVYTQEEVNAILSRAVEKQSPNVGLTLDEILDTAAQAGISREAVQTAEREVSESKEVTEEDRMVKEELEIERRRARRGLAAHFVTYVSVNALLIAINLLTSPFPWAILPALAWGVAMALHLFAVAVPSPRREQRTRNRVRAREKKAREALERERRREAIGPVGETAKELGQAIERGVATVFAAAAKRIHEEVARAGDGARGSQAPPGPGVRVGETRRVATKKESLADAPRRDEDEEDDEDEGEQRPAARRRR